ncbi:hypothetical protein NKG05_08005 [Oerskovia sp. M15]
MCAEALAHVAAGRTLPAVTPHSPGWRAGPLDGVAVDRVDALADAMPFELRATGAPVGGKGTRTARVREAMDAVVDTLVREAAARVGAPQGRPRT